MTNLRLICAPFAQLSLPSYDVAVLKAYLQRAGIEVAIDTTYLEYAVQLGGELYQSLYSSTLGDAVFSALLFPENRERLIKEFASLLSKEELDFNEIVETTERFVEEYITRVFDVPCADEIIVLFHVYTKQLFPALYMGKRINERYGLDIWLSGYHCGGDCGKSLLALFPHIKKVFGSNIEQSIIKETSSRHAADRPVFKTDAVSVPTPNYEDFTRAAANLPHEFLGKYLNQYWYQVEFNRGCPWNRCAFCTLNAQYPSFEQRSVDSITEDYGTIQSAFKTTRLLVTSRNCSENWKDLVLTLNRKYPGMKGTYDLSFKIADLLNEEDARFLSDNDISILVGVESLSKKCLRIINKGQTVIESIAVLKYMERHGVKCFYNLMCGLPFETDDDFKETQRVVDEIIHLPPPFSMERFRLTFGSEIQANPERYNIKSMGIRKNIEGILFPVALQDKYVPFFMDFESTVCGIEQRVKKFNQLIKEWTSKYYAYARKPIVRPKQHSLLYMRKNEWVIEVYDARFTDRYQIYPLFGLERILYEYCDKVRSLTEMQSTFPDFSERDILKSLDNLVCKRIMFKEDANFLSLAI